MCAGLCGTSHLGATSVGYSTLIPASRIIFPQRADSAR
jgi:hypothetical protein